MVPDMDSKWICAILASLVTGICLGIYAPRMPVEEPAAAVFAPQMEENLFAMDAPVSAGY